MIFLFQKTKDLFILLILLLIMAACSVDSEVVNMVMQKEEDSGVKYDLKYRDAIFVGEVTGGEATNPIWKSQVSNEHLKKALIGTLQSYGYYSFEATKYRLSAELMDLNQPLLGLDTKVSSTIKYTLTRVRDGSVVFRKMITHSHTIRAMDVLYVPTRVRLANEGAIKGNIFKFLNELIQNPES